MAPGSKVDTDADGEADSMLVDTVGDGYADSIVKIDGAEQQAVPLQAEAQRLLALPSFEAVSFLLTFVLLGTFAAEDAIQALAPAT